MVFDGYLFDFSSRWRKNWNETLLEQFGPALKLPWTKLKAPNLSKKLSSRLITGTAKQTKGKSVAMISNIRDQYLVDIQKLRKKYEKKLR